MSSGPATIQPHATATDTTAAQPTLVFVFSPTSGACRRADGFLAQVLQRRANHSTFRLVRIEAERRPDLLERLRVTELPTLLVIADGRVHGRLTKPTGCRQITHLLSPWLK
jgi:thioredoxin-like negative regulator of GroEL